MVWAVHHFITSAALPNNFPSSTSSTQTSSPIPKSTSQIIEYTRSVQASIAVQLSRLYSPDLPLRASQFTFCCPSIVTPPSQLSSLGSKRKQLD